MSEPADDTQRLKEGVEREVRRIDRFARERRSIMAQTVYLGTLGLLLVLPAVGGAYLGQWLDSLATGYSIRWTVSLIVLGIALGAFNVYLFLRD